MQKMSVCTGPMVINYGLENRLEKIASGLVLGSVTGEVPFELAKS